VTASGTEGRSCKGGRRRVQILPSGNTIYSVGFRPKADLVTFRKRTLLTADGERPLEREVRRHPLELSERPEAEVLARS